MSALWNLLPIGWRIGIAAAAVVALLGGSTAFGLYFHQKWYGDGYARATADAKARADAQEAAIKKIKADAEQQMADVAAILRKAQADDALQVAAVDQAAAGDAGADDICLSALVVQHLRAIGSGQRVAR